MADALRSNMYVSDYDTKANSHYPEGNLLDAYTYVKTGKLRAVKIESIGE